MLVVAADPSGTTLAAVRRFLSTAKNANTCGLFWDFASLPQWPRTPEQDVQFFAGLAVMARCYASIAGTAVLQLRAIPPRPAYFDGCITLFSGSHKQEDEAQLRSELGEFGQLTRLEYDDDVVNARFAMHEQAERCIAALKLRERPADFSYNTTSYDREHGIPYSGWVHLRPLRPDRVPHLPCVLRTICPRPTDRLEAARGLPLSLAVHAGTGRLPDELRVRR